MRFYILLKKALYLLNQYSHYTLTKQLCKLYFLYLDQFSIYDNFCFFSWKHIVPKLYKFSRRRKPLWFTIFKDLVIDHNGNRTFYEQYKLSDINYYSFSTSHFSLRSKP